MLPVTLRSVVLIGLFASALIADDPFFGKWKMNPAKSKLTGQRIEIQEVQGNSYRFQEDEHTHIVLVDGLDHLTHFGDTMAITKKKPDTWAITYKRGDQVLMSTIWKVSRDGRTLSYTASGTRPNGQHFYNKMMAIRMSGTSDLAGTWQTTGVTLSSPDEIYIQPWHSGGHLVTFPDREQTVRMDFDGKEYREDGPNVADGSTSSGRRLDDRTIETTERVKGKVVETAKSTISEDGRTQTIVVTEPDDNTPVVIVYERQSK